MIKNVSSLDFFLKKNPQVEAVSVWAVWLQEHQVESYQETHEDHPREALAVDGGCLQCELGSVRLTRKNGVKRHMNA